MSVPVWLVILSDQLPVIGLVGCYLTNYLMGRRLISKRLAPLVSRPYAVLATLSGRYSPLRGRLPTCYSPVCHYPSYCYKGPFDLHALGTPPAFILSQDQTLRLISLFRSKSRTRRFA